MAQQDKRDYPLGQTLTLAPYAQLHLAYQSFDDGLSTSGDVVDPATDPSVLGFHIRGASALSFQFESDLGIRATTAPSQIFEPAFWDWQKTDLRRVQFIYARDFGTIHLGQGSMPTDGVAQSDLGGTNLVAKSAVQEGPAGYQLRRTDGTLSGVTIGSVFNNMDGPRLLRARYDTPGINGFSLAGAYGREVLTAGVDDDYFDLVLRYDRDFSKIRVAGAFGTGIVKTSGPTQSKLVGSISILEKSSGLNLSVAAGRDNLSDSRYIYLKAGWNARLFPVGVTRLALESYFGEDYVTRGSSSRMVGFALVQNIAALRMDLYAGVRGFKYQDAGPGGYRDAVSATFGTRVRF